LTTLADFWSKVPGLHFQWCIGNPGTDERNVGRRLIASEPT
jgi:hypothetical protein